MTVVILAVWLFAMPRHAFGLIGNYGSVRTTEANALYRSYSMEGFECGGALMSPSDIGKVFWLRRPGGKWFGPCLSVDVASRKDFYTYVTLQGKILEVDERGMKFLDAEHGTQGEVYVGVCPPPATSVAREYSLPYVKFDPEGDRWTYWKHGLRIQQRPLTVEECRVYGNPSVPR